MRTLCRLAGSPIAPGGAALWLSMVSVTLMTHCGPGDAAAANTT